MKATGSHPLTVALSIGVSLICLHGVAAGQSAAPSAFERTLAIGDESRRDYQFGRVVGVAINEAGEIFVLDGMNHEVRVYSPAGRFLRRFGRQGGGPGEFMLPGRMILTRDDVLVLDPRLQRVTRFDHSGDLQETINVAEEGLVADVAVPLRGGVWLAVKSVFVLNSGDIRSFAEVSGRERRTRMREHRAAGESLILSWQRGTPAAPDTLFRFDPGGVFYFDRDRGLPFGFLPVVSPPLGAWAVAGDSLVGYVNSATGDVHIARVADGRLRVIRNGRIPLTPAPVGPADVRDLEKQGRAHGNLPADVEIGAPSHRAQLGAPLFGADGALWIRRLDARGLESRSVQHRYLVVPIDGSEQREVRTPIGLTVLHVGRGVIVGSREDELGVQSVELWRWRP